MMQLSTGVSISDLADQVCFSVETKIPEKQSLLETLIVSQRLKAATEYLIQEMKVAELERSIEERLKKNLIPVSNAMFLKNENAKLKKN